jgi:transposase
MDFHVLPQHEQNDPEIALGPKAGLFARSDRGGERAAVILTLIHTATQRCRSACRARRCAARIADHKINDLAALPPWNWRAARIIDRAA